MHYINYRENRQRGTVDFPIEFHHVSTNHPQYLMPIHWHVEYEIIRVLEGELLLIIDEKEFLITKGCAILIPAGSVHEGKPQNDCVYECVVFDINMLMNKSDSCCKLIRKITNHEVELQYYFSNFCNNIHKIINCLFDALTAKTLGYELIVQGSLYQLLGEIFEKKYYSESPSQTPRDLKRIVQLKQALEFIESSYATQVSLQEISDSVNMSPKYFCRFFQEMTHRTPFDYLNYYRIERACYQLLTTNQTITEVAFSCGFNDLSYFIKTFKKYKGITPKKYLMS